MDNQSKSGNLGITEMKADREPGEEMNLEHLLKQNGIY